MGIRKAKFMFFMLFSAYYRYFKRPWSRAGERSHRDRPDGFSCLRGAALSCNPRSCRGWQRCLRENRRCRGWRCAWQTSRWLHIRILRYGEGILLLGLHKVEVGLVWGFLPSFLAWFIRDLAWLISRRLVFTERMVML